MSDPETFWFHCGRCGSLFQSEADETADKLCPKCGFDPCPDLAARPEDQEKPAANEPAKSKKTKAHGRGGPRNGGHAKNRHLMLKLIGAWTLVLALIIIGARQIWPETQPDHLPSTTDATTDDTAEEVAEEAVLLQSALPKCWAALSGFLAAGPEGRNQFVLSPVSTASRMTRFYSLNPWTDIDPTTLKLTAKSILRLPGETAIETHWNTPDGKQTDAVFRQQHGEWLLDWDQFARYSDHPWPLFLAGTGPDEGEFRLLARERLAEERKGESTISIVLYAPRFGHPGETGFQSPEFLVPRDSRDGRLLAGAFQLSRERKRVFASQIPELNPDDMIRLRLKVRRSESDQGRRFEISSITACHWLSIDDPGVDPAPTSSPASSSPSIAEP